jgi:anthranilate phosphoribosyltransferase
LEQARALFGAMLDGEVPALQLGAILIAFRVKGESRDELRGFLLALEERVARLRPPRSSPRGVVIPSYNGARHSPNFVPLLALGLRARGIPVLVHGVMRDPRRVTTAQVFAALGVQACVDPGEAEARLEEDGLAFVPVGALCPGLDRLLEIRWQLGVRNSAHTACKMLQPIAGPALQIVSVTQPDYLTGMREYFTAFPADVLLMRGSEGEAVASLRRPQAIEWIHDGTSETVVPAVQGSVTLVDLPAIHPEATAQWIQAAIKAGSVPRPIAAQIDAIEQAVRRDGSGGGEPVAG